MACRFLRGYSIDSFQKLRLLLWTAERPGREFTIHQLAEQLYLGDIGLIEEIVADLNQAGLVRCEHGQCSFQNSSEASPCLDCLQSTFADPQARQELLASIDEVAALNAEGLQSDDRSVD